MICTRMRFGFLFILLLLTATPVGASEPERIKPRLLVLTDVSNEPDDEESLVRLLVYANEFDIEGLIATTSVHLKDSPRPDILHKFVQAYGQVQANLSAHAQGFPLAEDLDKRITTGATTYGLAAVGPGKSTPGSKQIVAAVDAADPRPVWVAVWGGANTLAQALFDVRASRTRQEIDRFIAKLRVYAISDQDDAGEWIRKSFKNLAYVVSPTAVGGSEYYKATWTGISGDRFYKNGPGIDFALVQNAWLERNVIQGHGPLGALYPKWKYIMEGDTPSFMNLIGNGLAAEEDPTRGGWGGRYALSQTYGETRPIYTNSRDTVSQTTSAQATIWRWRSAYQNDFAARMDWCTTPVLANANHNPDLVLQGDASKRAVMIEASPGATMSVSSAGSQDPDGQPLKLSWFVYPEAGTAHLEVSQRVTIRPSVDGRQLSFTIPSDADGGTVHVILTAQDNGTPRLSSYRRLIVKIKTGN
jgi:hypothetical protein